MSRINHPIETGLAGGLSLAAVAPASAAAMPTSRRAGRDRRPRRYRSRMSHRTMALAGATRGSEPPAASGSRYWPPAAASSPPACAGITSTPPRDRRAR